MTEPRSETVDATTIAAPAARAPCDSEEATDYTAALREGTLTDAGIEHLATHTIRCETCRILLIHMIGETHKDGVATIIRRIEQARQGVAECEDLGTQSEVPVGATASAER